MKFKNSNQGCKLYIRYLTEKCTEQELRDLFSAYGNIERLRLFSPRDASKRPSAYVFFKTPQ